MVLYESQLLLESGRPEEALRHLHAFEQHVCDLLTFWETKGGKREKRGEEKREGRREGRVAGRREGLCSVGHTCMSGSLLSVIF